MQAILSFLGAILGWIVDLVTGVFLSAYDLLTDIPILFLEALLDVFAAVLESIPVPEFMAGGMDSFFSGLPSSILYLLGQIGFGKALLIVGAGYTFRLSRKLFTLGQW